MWNKEADVIVVGCGGAGATAAIAAHDAGARVIVLEKNPEGGGNTLYSGGTIRQFLDAEKAITYIQGFAFGSRDRDIVRSYVEECMDTPRWIKELGGKLEKGDVAARAREFPTGADILFPHLPGADGYGIRWLLKEPGVEASGATVWGFLFRNVEKRGIEVIFNTGARQLITGKNREVIGVLADSSRGEIRVKARRGVILA